MNPAAVTTARLNGLYHLGELPAALAQELAARALELRRGAAPADLSGRALGLLFLNPSLRTQASFQRAAAKLRLDLVLLQGESTWALETRAGAVMDGAAVEHVKEATAVLGRYVDVLGVRSFAAGRDLEEDLADAVVTGFRRHAGVPVVNLESAQWHPCQALADWTTLEQLAIPQRAKFVLTWAWHPKPLPQAVPNSTLCMAAQRGMEVVLLHPPGYELHDSVLAEARRWAAAAGGSLTVTHDRKAALAGAAAVYAKSYGSLRHWGRPEEEIAARAHLRDWRVTPDWLAPGAKFMHCLPVRRNVVVSDAVLDGPASVVIDQAENRLHAQTALLERVLASNHAR